MIRLLALDLDGTLLDVHGNIPERNRKAILAAEQRGVLVTIVTGRRFRDAQPVGLALSLNAPIICHNGALTKYAHNLETVKFSLLEPDTLAEIVQVGKSFGADAMLSCDPVGKGTLYYDRVSDENTPLRKYIEWSRRLHGDEAEEAVVHVEDLTEVIDTTQTVHVSFSGGCTAMEALRELILRQLRESVNIFSTVYPSIDFTLLDILPVGASKGVGLADLAMIHGITHEGVMAIGDNFNDLEMLRYAGTPVVMGNAADELKNTQGFHTTSTNNDAGVADAIERFILDHS